MFLGKLFNENAKGNFVHCISFYLNFLGSQNTWFIPYSGAYMELKPIHHSNGMSRANHTLFAFWKKILTTVSSLALCSIGDDKEGIYVWRVRRRGKKEKEGNGVAPGHSALAY